MPYSTRLRIGLRTGRRPGGPPVYPGLGALNRWAVSSGSFTAIPFAWPVADTPAAFIDIPPAWSIASGGIASIPSAWVISGGIFTEFPGV